MRTKIYTFQLYVVAALGGAGDIHILCIAMNSIAAPLSDQKQPPSCTPIISWLLPPTIHSLLLDAGHTPLSHIAPLVRAKYIFRREVAMNLAVNIG